jgi:hypothetical protein
MKRAGCCRAIAVCLLLLTALVAGCSPDDSDLSEGELGTLQVPLTSTGADGSLYELSGTLTVTGPAGMLTFDLAESDTFEVALPPGQYSVELSSFLVSKDGVPLSDAVLVSPNPQSVAIRPRLPATVVFRFVRGGGLVVDFSVDERGFWFAGEFTVGEDAAGQIPVDQPTGLFAQYAGVTIGFFILFDNLTSVSYFEGSTGQKFHEYVAEGAHLSFDGDPHGVFSGDIQPDLDNNRLTVFAVRDPTGVTFAVAAFATSTLEVDLTQDHSGLVCLGQAVLPVDGAGFADLVPFPSREIAPFPQCVVAHTADGGVTYSDGAGRASVDFDWLASP